MPFTPIHMGPGMAVKAALPRHFSIVVFGLTQITVDLEVLWYLARWNPPLHRFWHTYLGATVVATVLALAGRPVRLRFFLRRGRLYAFWVSPSSSGASLGRVAAGGPGFTGPTDTVGREI